MYQEFYYAKIIMRGNGSDLITSSIGVRADTNLAHVIYAISLGAISLNATKQLLLWETKVGSATAMAIISAGAPRCCWRFSQTRSPSEIFTLHLLVVINQQRPGSVVSRGPPILAICLSICPSSTPRTNNKGQFMWQRDNDVCRFLIVVHNFHKVWSK